MSTLKDFYEEYNDKINELKAENKRLKDENEKLNKMTGIFSARLCGKYHTTLQEIKAIVEQLLEKGLEPQSVEHQLKLKGKRELANIILDIITKVESEE